MTGAVYQAVSVLQEAQVLGYFDYFFRIEIVDDGIVDTDDTLVFHTEVGVICTVPDRTVRSMPVSGSGAQAPRVVEKKRSERESGLRIRISRRPSFETWTLSGGGFAKDDVSIFPDVWFTRGIVRDRLH